jgi:hypothetical protein
MDVSLAKDQEDAADYLFKANLFTSKKDAVARNLTTLDFD